MSIFDRLNKRDDKEIEGLLARGWLASAVLSETTIKKLLEAYKELGKPEERIKQVEESLKEAGIVVDQMEKRFKEVYGIESELSRKRKKVDDKDDDKGFLSWF